MDCISILGAYLNEIYFENMPEPDAFLKDATTFYVLTKIPPDPWVDIEAEALEKICLKKQFYMRACDDPIYKVR